MGEESIGDCRGKDSVKKWVLIHALCCALSFFRHNLSVIVVFLKHVFTLQCS